MSLSKIPEKITSGDTVMFSIPSGVISNDLELQNPSLSVTFRNSSGIITETTTVNPLTGTFDFKFKATAWSSGYMNWTAFASDQNNRFTLGYGRTLVLQDPSNTSTAMTHAEKVLAAIEASIEGTATEPQMMMSINGRMIQRYGITDLLKFRGLYKREVEQEQKAKGYGNKDKIKVRFNNSPWGMR